MSRVSLHHVVRRCTPLLFADLTFARVLRKLWPNPEHRHDPHAHPPTRHMIRLDARDIDILRALARDGRMTNAALAKRAGRVFLRSSDSLHGVGIRCSYQGFRGKKSVGQDLA